MKCIKGRSISRRTTKRVERRGARKDETNIGKNEAMYDQKTLTLPLS
jgi:hypothetical protein